jgi:DNA-binding MarR family transcriptional regulator
MATVNAVASEQPDADNGWVTAETSRLAFLLKRAQLLLVERYAGALEAHGIGPRGLGVLTELAEYGPMSQQQLSLELSVDRTTMVGVVDDLEAQGLVVRRAHPRDRRMNLIAPTDEGLALFHRLSPEVDQAEAGFLATLSPEEAGALRSSLRAVIAAASTG